MGWTFTGLFAAALFIFWVLSHLAEELVYRLLRWRYTHEHFKLTERYRREL